LFAATGSHSFLFMKIMFPTPKEAALFRGETAMLLIYIIYYNLL
jgi:hypothetical protein